MPPGHRRGLAACPDGPARRGRRPCTHRVREGEATAPLVALAGGRVPRVGVVRGELKPVLIDPLPRSGRSSGPQSRQVMEVAVADVLAERVHDAPRVVMGAFDVHGIPSLPNSRSHTPSHSPRCPAAFAKSACGSNPSPRAYPIAPNTIRWARTSGTSTGAPG